MSSSVGMVASFSDALRVSPECMWHHQKTAFTLRVSDIPRWFLSISRKRAFRLSAALFVLGSGPASVSAGSRYVNSVPSETSLDSSGSPPRCSCSAAGPPRSTPGPGR